MAQTKSASGLIPTPNKFQVNIWLAIWAGVLGQIVFMFTYAPVYFMFQEDSLDLLRLFGSFVTTQEPWTHLLGLGAMMGIGVGTALAYAWIMYILNLQSSGAMGMVYGAFVFVPIIAFVIPWTVGFLALLTGVRMNNPDVGFNQIGHANAGWDAQLIMLVAYVLYGLVVGAVYRHKLRDLKRYQVAYQGG